MIVNVQALKVKLGTFGILHRRNAKPADVIGQSGELYVSTT